MERSRTRRDHRGAPPPRTQRPDEPLLTRRQLLFVGAAAASTLGYWSYATQRSGAEGVTTSPSTAASSTTSAATTPTPSAVVSVPVASPTTTTVPPLTNSLSRGMVGAEVERLQAALVERRFDPGPVDGIFGQQTVSAVWAFEKLIVGTPREDMRAVVTPEMWEQLNTDFEVTPRRTPGGTHMEVYLPEQVSVLFEDAVPRVISHVSSGAGVEWCDVVEIDLDDGTAEEKGICGISITPGGVYHFDRKVDGWRNAKLGRLYKPVYFNYGIAIHGATEVPDYPASRGCVRHPMHIADYLPDLIAINDMIYVFDGVEEPETYGAQPMIFDYPDPNWVPPTTTSSSTTTSSTTTSSTTTTSTTVAPTPTTAPPSASSSVPASSSTSSTTTSTPGR